MIGESFDGNGFTLNCVDIMLLTHGLTVI